MRTLYTECTYILPHSAVSTIDNGLYVNMSTNLYLTDSFFRSKQLFRTHEATAAITTYLSAGIDLHTPNDVCNHTILH
jgi:hypothetical protein